MDMDILLPLIFMSITIPLTGFMIFLALRKRKRRFSSGVFKDQGFFKASNRGTGTGTIDGVQYRYHYHPGSRNSPPQFRVMIDCATYGKFKLSRETAFDRFFKRFGLSSEIQTGDPEFDQQFYITTNDTAWTRLVLNPAAKRRMALDIYNSGFNEIQTTGKKIIATCRPLRKKNKITRDLIERTAANLVAISRELPSAGSVPHTRDDSNWKLKRALVFGVVIGAGVLGTLALVMGLIRYRPLNFGPLFLFTLKYSIPAGLVFLFAALTLLKGRASSHVEFLVVLFLVLFGFPIAGAGLGVFLNGHLDPDPGRVQRTEVVDKMISESDDSNTYYAIVRSWRRNGTEKIRISRADYQQLRPGYSSMTIVSHPGRYHFEWIESAQVEAF